MPRVQGQSVIRLLIVTIVTVSSLVASACNADARGKTTNAAHVLSTKEAANAAHNSMPMNTQQTVESRLPWNEVQNWAYWLDNPDLKQLSASTFDLLVIDSSADGSAAQTFSAEQIKTLRQTHPQRRVVAYLSIGQAESYRGYWQPGWRPGSPTWLGAEDPHWHGNYWVKYWDPAWQQVIYHYLDAIIAAGFDGIYLDRIDAYQESYAAGHEDAMVQFVTSLAQYARAHSSLGEDFGIIAQNAEDLAGSYPDYVRLVTGIGREEVYVRATDIPTSQAERAQAEHYLDLFRQNSRGKLVLTVDYATRPDLVCAASQRARIKGYVPFVTDVGLDRLPGNPSC
jgi:cysteinyl-tRNA synthetase